MNSSNKRQGQGSSNQGEAKERENKGKEGQSVRLPVQRNTQNGICQEEAKPDDPTGKVKVLEYYKELDQAGIASLVSSPDVDRVFRKQRDGKSYADFAFEMMGLRVGCHINDFIIFMMLLKKITAITYSVLVILWEEEKEYCREERFRLCAHNIQSVISEKVKSLLPSNNSAALEQLCSKVYWELEEIIPKTGHASGHDK
ncbi:hypothetical protein TRICI_004485 [Trichomonascus ciferrii]|uniref:Uncharacterized protein n=1 Tax=Trichomonascus ciferrii TaxID=44093 RepID=A0A642V0I2_9ASCO|nr:hypothetical protein TRICI_004485 [Trichomonascus ciferrii]